MKMISFDHLSITTFQSDKQRRCWMRLQDTMDLLFRGESVAARGTYAQLKEYFNHRSLKKNVMANVQHVWDMVEVNKWMDKYSLAIKNYTNREF